MTHRSSFVRKWDPADEPILDYVTLNILGFLWVGFLSFSKLILYIIENYSFYRYVITLTDEIQLD